jgi:RNA polymerase sigma-70 factor (ECF subfamily)
MAGQGANGMQDSAALLGWKAEWDVTMTRPESQARERSSAADLDEADDRALVAAFLGGRREAFDAIVNRHRRNVYLLCYRFLGNHEDASDMAQDVFVRAFKGLVKFKNEASLGTWLYRVSVNACLNRVAVRVPDTEPVDSAPRVDARAVDPLNEVMRLETTQAVRRAIRKLPPKQRATLVLRVYQELSHEEIARVLGTSVGAAKANLFHALGNLKRLMDL